MQPNIYSTLLKVNQVIYTLDTIGAANIMTIAQRFSRYFVDKVLYGLNACLKMGYNSVKYSQNFMKS